jgi:BlaI family transcriptional regulator, penicillinase repressor
MTKKTTQKRLTPLEALIMDRVWEDHPVTVREVQDALHSERPMAYNTVLTMMRILRDKGFLASERKGRMDLYRPLVKRQQMAKRGLNELLHGFFAGSAQALVSQLLESEAIDPDEMEAIRRDVDRKLHGTNGG